MTTVDVLTYVITGDVSQLEDSLSEVDVSSKKLLRDIQKNFKGLGADVESKVDEIVTQFVHAAHTIKEAAGKDLTFQEAIDSVQTLSKEFLKISDNIAPLVRGDIEAWAKTITDSIGSMKSPDAEAYHAALARMWEEQKQVYAERESIIAKDADARERAADVSIAAYEREKQALMDKGEEDERRFQNYLRIQAQLKEAAEIRAAAEEENRYREALANAAWQAEAEETLKRRQEETDAMNAQAEAAMRAYEAAKAQKEEEELAGNVIGTSSERVTELKEHLEELSEKYEKLKDKITPVVEGTQTFTSALNSLAGVAGLDISAGTLNSLIKDAGKAEKALTRLTSVYKTSANDAVSISKRIADSYGLSVRAAEEMLAYAGQVFTEQGFMADQALEMAENFVKRAVDLQSMTQGGTDAAAALKAMVSALISGTKALKSYGVAFTSQDVMTEAAIHNLNTYNGKLEGSSKILAAYYTILNKTSEAEGDFARNEENLVNIQQEYNAALEELRIAMGEAFLPAMKDLLQTLTGLAEFMGEHKWFSSFLSTALAGVVVLKGLSSAVGVGAKALADLKLALNTTAGAFAVASAAATAFNAALGVIAIAGAIASLFALKAAADSAASASQTAADAADSMANKGALTKKEVKDLNSDWKTLNKDITKSQNEVTEQQEYLNYLIKMEAENYKQYGDYETAYNKATSKKAKEAAKEWMDVYWYATEAVGATRREEEKELAAREARVQRAENAREAFVLELSRGYLEAGEDAAVLNGLDKELITDIEAMTVRLKEAQEAGLDLDAYARTLSRTTADWDTLLRNAETHLNNAMKAAEKATGDYNVTLLRNIDLLKQQRKEYDDTSRTQLDTIMRLNGLSEESAALLQQNVAAIVAGDKSIEDWADGITEDTSAVELQIRYIIQAMLSAEKWFNTESEAYRQEFINSATSDMDKFTEYLAKLTDKTATTLMDQYNKTVDGGVQVFKDVVTAAYGGVGGLTGVLADFIGAGNGGADFPLQKFMDDAVKMMRDGEHDIEKIITSLQTTYRTFDLTENTAENKDAVNKFIASLRLALTALLGVEEEADRVYTEAVDKLLKSAQEKRLQAEQNNAKATLKVKRDHEKALLEAEQEADRKSYQQQLGANYENEEAYKALLAAQEAERNNLKDKWAVEDAELLRAHNQTMLNFVASSAFGAEEAYKAQMAIYAEEYRYRIKHAQETGESVYNINKEWAAQSMLAYREYVSSMKSEMDNLRNIVIEGQKKANKEDLFTDILSFANIGNIQRNLALTLEEIIRGGLDKLTNENKLKYEKAVAEGKLDIAQMIADGMSVEEMKSKLEELGLAGNEFEAVWFSICQDCADATEDANDAIKKALEDSVDAMMNYYSKVNDLFGAFSDNKKTRIQNTMAEYQKMYDQFSDSLQKRNEENTEGLTKKEKDELERRKKMDEDEMNRMQALIDEQETLLDEQKRKDFEREKAFSIAETTIDGIKAAVKAYSSAANPVYGAVLAGISSAFTAAQIAAIASQPYPSYAVGAYELPQDQLAQVHKGEMIVPRPFAEELRDNGGLGGEITVNLYGVGEGADVETSENADARQIDVYVSSKVRAMVARGELDGVLQSRYVLSRNGRRG